MLVTRDSAIPYLTSLTVAPISITVRHIPSEVTLTPLDGLPADCAVSCDNLQTVTKAKLGDLITHLSGAKRRELRDAIHFALGFDGLE